MLGKIATEQCHLDRVEEGLQLFICRLGSLLHEMLCICHFLLGTTQQCLDAARDEFGIKGEIVLTIFLCSTCHNASLNFGNFTSIRMIFGQCGCLPIENGKNSSEEFCILRTVTTLRLLQ